MRAHFALPSVESGKFLKKKKICFLIESLEFQVGFTINPPEIVHFFVLTPLEIHVFSLNFDIHPGIATTFTLPLDFSIKILNRQRVRSNGSFSGKAHCLQYVPWRKKKYSGFSISTNLYSSTHRMSSIYAVRDLMAGRLAGVSNRLSLRKSINCYMNINKGIDYLVVRSRYLSVLTCLYNYNLTSCKRSVARRIRVLITHQTVAMIHMHMYNSKMKLVEKIKGKDENNCTRKLSNLWILYLFIW